MAGWNGSGTFSRTNDWTEDQANGIAIRADRHDQNDVDFVSGINNCMTKDGQNSATANLNMGGFKLTNGAAATLAGDFSIVSDIQAGSFVYATSGGSANAYTLTLSPAETAYVAGQVFRFKANFATTGASTLNVNGIGAKTIKKLGDSTDTASNDIVIDQIVTVVYDGTVFQMEFNPENTAAAAVTLGSITASSTTTFTNKTYDADGTGNVLTNVGSSEIKSEIITGQSTVTAVSGDFVLISDTGDSGNLKKADIADLIPSTATTSAEGIVELSTDAEVVSRTSTRIPTANQVGLIPISSVTISSDATADFTSSIDSTFDTYEFELFNVIPATDGAFLNMSFSNDGGSTFNETLAFTLATFADASDSARDGSTSATAARFTSSSANYGVGSAAIEGVSGTLKIYDPSDSSEGMKFEWHETHVSDGSVLIATGLGGGAIRLATAIDGVRFSFSAGNLATGKITMSARRPG